MPLVPSIRKAQAADIPVLQELIARSARGLSIGYYTPAQIDAAIRHVFGVDSQLIADGTYFVVELEGTIVGVRRLEPAPHAVRR